MIITNFVFASFDFSSLKCETVPANSIECPNNWTIVGSNGSLNCYLTPSTALTRTYSGASQYCLNLGSLLMVSIKLEFIILYFSNLLNHLKKVPNSEIEFTNFKIWMSSLKMTVWVIINN